MRWRNRNRLTILMFHGFTDQKHQGLENAQHKHLEVQKFEAFLKHLTQHFHMLSLDQAVNHLNHRTPLPQNSVVLTFDDGFRSNFLLAYPLLKKWRAPALIYLATEFVDEKKPIWVDRVDHALNQAGKSVKDLIEAKKHLKKLPQESIESAVTELENRHGGAPLNLQSSSVAEIYKPLEWEQIKEMQDSGLVTFGAHTHSHKILGRCRDETVYREVRLSKQIIEEKTGHPCVHFCYPNGGRGDYSQQSEAILKDTGFQSSVLALGGLNRLPCSPFSLKRLGVTNGLSQAEFELTVSGFLPWLEHIK